ncbi:uncharacterized protein A4U43_C02F19280 [Asparagus officinalis]|uniref:Uncharacterized protein n=1 Tax=Asparagus officinalis TaxID=4686 RepID=A0A5P1FM55_ASPOF|nr:uncharacterized protein A4U43_C02F19280 [Asparagus officinalis]
MTVIVEEVEIAVEEAKEIVVEDMEMEMVEREEAIKIHAEVEIIVATMEEEVRILMKEGMVVEEMECKGMGVVDDASSGQCNTTYHRAVGVQVGVIGSVVGVGRRSLAWWWFVANGGGGRKRMRGRLNQDN